MAVNTMTFNQLATVLASIVSQATGTAVLTPTDTSSFVSVGKLGLETGMDPLNNAINQVLSKTIFSVRPYNSKLSVLEWDRGRWGNHVRKINFGDTGFIDDVAISLTDGYSVDQQVVKKPALLQTNFYGINTYSKMITIYRDQMDVAMQSPEEFASLIGGIMSTVSDELEQARENTARATVTNLIGGHYLLEYASATKGCAIHLLTEYNAFSGQSLTASTVFAPSNFPGFAKWMYGRLATVSRMMTERSALYHLNFTSKPVIMRHTPVERQRLILLAQNMDQVATNVLSSVYNDGYLKTIPRTEIGYWQSIQSPAAINLDDAGYVGANGAVASGDVSLSNVFGVLFDEEAAGYTVIKEDSSPAPYNARGRYTNFFWNQQYRFANDFSENCVVLLLD